MARRRGAASQRPHSGHRPGEEQLGSPGSGRNHPLTQTQSLLQMELGKQLRAFLLPLAAGLGEHWKVTRPVYSFLQLHPAPELLTVANGAIHQKRAGFTAGCGAGWNVIDKNWQNRLVAHEISPVVGG